MKAKQFIPNQADFLSQLRTQRREQTEKRLCRNSYGQDPIKEAIRNQSLKEYRRRKAQEQEERNRRTKARREAREAEEANRSRKPTAQDTNEVLYYMGSYGGATAREINPVLRTEATQAETEPTGTPQGQIRPLSNKDFITLYYSNKLLIGGKNPREADPTNKLEENEVIKHLRHLDPIVRLTETANPIEIKTSNLYSIRLTTDQANTPQALKYLLSFKGQAEKVTNTQENELKATRPILSYNYIGYEPNEIIIISKKEDIERVKKQFEEKNTPQKSYYNFIGEDNPKQRIKRTIEKNEEAVKFKTIRGTRSPREQERLLNRLRKTGTAQNLRYEEEDTAGKAELINKCLYYSFIVIEAENLKLKTEVIGLNNIRKNEKEITKALREPKSRKYETAEAVQEAIEEAKATDGRQKTKNIEHDLRKALKHFKTETSTALYYIIEAIEEETEEKEKGEKVLSQKKLTALLNVLKGFKSYKEAEEEKTDYLTEQLEEANGKHNKNKFKADKKSKNLYSNKTGITKKNRHPTKSNIKSISEVLQEKAEKQREREEAERENRQFEPTKTIARRNNTARLKEIAKIKQEVQAEKKAERVREEARNPTITFKMLVRGINKQINEYREIKKEIERRKRQRHLNDLEKEVIRSFYGERTPQEEKILIQDHKSDNTFKTGLQIETEKNKAN